VDPTGVSLHGRPAERLPFLYAASSLLAAFLLFQVQLVVGKRLLPWFGGSPAVWITCLLFFQGTLLAGYAYAHALIRFTSRRAGAIVYLASLAATLILLATHAQRWGSPILPRAAAMLSADAAPVSSILFLLATSVGLPAVVLSATAPLVQAWFVRGAGSGSPYRLYAWSNFGSLLGLVTYVLVVEPLLPLRRQAVAWSALFAALVIALAVLAWRSAATATGDSVPTGVIALSPPAGAVPTGSQRALAVVLSFAGSALLLAATQQICQEIAVLPFLWVLPLVLYLGSFMLAFASPRWRSRRLTGPLLLASSALVCGLLYYQLDIPATLQIGGFALALFGCCLAWHGELASLQPSTRFLTSYYLLVAAGGALGGLFVAGVAPLLFRGLWELHATLFVGAAAYVAALLLDGRSWLRRGRVAGAAVALLAAAGSAAWLVGTAVERAAEAAGRPPISELRPTLIGGAFAIVAYFGWRLRRRALSPVTVAALYLGLSLALFAWILRSHIAALTGSVRFAARDFFAAVQVREVEPDDPRSRAWWLVHGRIVHGFQYDLPARRKLPTSYYSRDSGLALAITRHPLRRSDPAGALRIGVLGLGVGTAAAYAERGDRLQFYEISPSVIRLARGDGGYFTYLHDTPAAVEIVPGDARVALEDELRRGLPQHFDVLVLDAFASGAVPVHLLTREALRTYLAHLAAPDGILAINVSNRTLDLPRVVWRLAAEERLTGVSIESDAARDGSTWHSLWILLSRDRAIFDDAAIAAVATAAPARSDETPLWTDEHSSLLGILRPEVW